MMEAPRLESRGAPRGRLSATSTGAAPVREKADHPSRMPILEAFRWIGEPLSAISTVDVLDGYLSMWEVARHLRILETLGIVEPVRPRAGQATTRNEVFGARYRLKAANDHQSPGSVEP